jgi:hypothetical protein
MKNPLTPEQQARLKLASSGLSTDRFSELSLSASNAFAHRIDLVLLELHQESPFAFNTYAYLDNTRNKVVFEDKKSFGIPFSQHSYKG